MPLALRNLLAAAALFLAACGLSTVGHPCTTNAECGNPWTCYTNAPGGLCTRGCDQEGTGKDCPGGTVCASSSGGLVCAVICQSAGECRAEYDCTQVAGGGKMACTAK